MLPRVFRTGTASAGDTVMIDGDDGHHFAKVLRVKAGEPLVVSLTNGSWLGHISNVSPKSIEVHLERAYPSSEAQTKVVLVQGIAKGDKMEAILQKSVEIGVHSLIVYQAKRSVVRLEGKIETKLERWRKVIREAAMQAQRDLIPTLYYARDGKALFDFCSSEGVEQSIVLDEAEDSTGLKAALGDDGNALTKRAILIGPEGGWSDEERALFQQHNASFATLGPRILRTETAGAAALAITLAYFGDMGG